MYKQFKSQRLWEAMKTACEEGDFEKVFELIKDGQDPRHGMSWMELKPLHCAAFHGNLEVVRTLVEEHGCNPRSVGNNKCTPLHYACYGGHQDVVKYLVTKQRCDPHLKSNEGCRPLHFTCIHEELDTYDISVRLMGSWYSSLKHEISTSGHCEVAKFLLTEGGCNVVGSYKRAPPLVVHLACRYGTVEFVQFLIEQKNCCPNNKNKNKDTPVHVASKYGNVEILRYLVEVKGCNLIQQNKDGNTPLHLACIFQHFETIQYLVKKQPCLTMVANHDKALPVHLACCEDSPETVELVTSASNVTAKGHNGVTPLHVASSHGSLQVVKWLIEEMHCDPNIEDDHHLTPLHWACSPVGYNYSEERIYSKYVQIAEYLVASCGCDPMMNYRESTLLDSHWPLMQVACRKDLELAKALASYNVNGVDKYGNTPLHLACKESQLKFVQFLVLERHCRQDIQNDRSELPLHIACSQLSLEPVHYIFLDIMIQTLECVRLLPEVVATKPATLPPQLVNLPLELVKLVSTHCDINATTKIGGDTPVHIACRHYQIDTVTYLTQERHCALNIANNKGELPLHIACQQKSLEMVKLVGKCDTNALTKSGDTPVHTACTHSQIDMVTEERRCILNIALNNEGELPLHIACQQNSLEMVKLVEKCDVNIPKKSGDTPVHIACRHYQIDIVTYLTQERHCDVNIPNNKGELPLHIACQWNSLEMARLVGKCDINVPTKSGDTPVHIACRHYQIDIVTYLTQERHCDVNIPNNEGELPLHIACQWDSLEMVKLVSSCDLHVQTKRGFTAMQIACENNATGIIEHLVQEKSWKCKLKMCDDLLIHCACSKGSGELVRKLANPTNVNTRFPNVEYPYAYNDIISEDEFGNMYLHSTYDDTNDASGNVPLHEACKYANVEVVKILVNELQCDRAVRNAKGELPLHLACREHSLEIVELVSSNSDATVQNSEGDTPLHIACEHGQMDIVKYLTEKRLCDLTIQNRSNKLAVHYACQHSLEIVELVSDCDLESKTSGDGLTPLHIACLNRKLDIVRYLIENKKCNPDVETSDGLTLLDYACGKTRHYYYSYTSNPKQENEERAAIIKYLMSKCDYDPANVVSLFVKACKENNLEIAKLLCTNTDIVNSSDAEGNTPLHIACMYRHLEVVQFLTEERNCNQQVKSQAGNLPLHIACEGDTSLEIVKLVSKCDVNAQTALGDTPLHIACRHNNVELVQFLTEECQCDQNIQNKDGELPLHIACSQTSLKLVKLVSSCQVNIQTVDKSTPLHLACRYQQVNIARFLVHTKGADPSILDGNGQNYLHEACVSGNLSLVKLLATKTTVNSRDKDGNTPLHIACTKKRLDIAKFLVEEALTRTDLSIQNRNGDLAIHIACEKRSLPLTKLVSHCSLNIKNCAGNTPLHVACKQGAVQCVKYLLKKRSCNVTAENVNGEIPLHLAVNTSINAMELVRHCEVNSRTVSGDTPLHIACRKDNPKIVQYLLEVLKCDPNLLNINDELPLHIACSQASLKIVKLVSDCDPNVKTSSGDTALHLVCRRASSEIMQYLMEQKCYNPDIQNANGETPLHIACHEQDLKTVKLIGKFVHNPNLATLSGDTPLHVACKSTKNTYIHYSQDVPSRDIVKYLVTTMKCNLMSANKKGELPLHLACKWTLELVKLVSNCEINSQTVDGNTPLHIACEENKMDIVKYLTETKKCDANIQNQKGELPLHIATTKGNLEMAILVCNCNVNAVTTAGDTPLHLALSSYHEVLVRFLVSKGIFHLKIPNNEGKLPLHIACETHTPSIIRLVGVCDVNARTRLGDTPLHIACRSRLNHPYTSFAEDSDLDSEFDSEVDCYNGDNVPEVFTYLVKERDCDLSVQNNDKELPLHIACQNCSLDVIKLVSECNVELKTASGDTPLHLACKRGDSDIVEYLVTVRHCSPRVYNSDNELPLHIACETCANLDTVKLLCSSDINVNTKTHQSGNTPLHYACRSKYYAGTDVLIKYLMVEKSANPSIQNNSGQLPLHIACSNRNISLKVVELLSNCDADFNCRTLTGDTPLHEACKADAHHSDSKKQVVQFLVEKLHCDPNCQNNAGMTPLHYACKMNARKTVLYLLSTGKVGHSVTAENSDGQTPITLTDDIEIMRELLKHGANSRPLYERYEKFFKECSSETPPPTPFNVLVLGNSSTGKTTLIESLKEEGKLVVQDTSPDAHTAGIIPNRFKSNKYGLVTFDDFAGQHEYYASHEAVIRTIVRSTPPVIILLVNISESEEKIRQKILYWLSFIGNQFPTVTSKPHLIITGSHADVIQDHGDNPHTKMESVIDSIESQLEKSAAKFVAFTTMNCRVSESPGISNLRKQLQKSSKELKDSGVMNFMSHCFHIYLLEYFKDLPAVSLSQITSCLLQKQKSEYHTYPSYYPHYLHRHYHYQSEDKKPERLLPTKPSEIDSILEELSEKGHVVFLKSFRKRSSWVILNKEALLGDINGTIFAPKGFKQHKELACSSSTGVVPFSTIASHFPKFDPNMIVRFLSHLEFCHVIADEEVLNLIEGNQAHSTTSSASSELYFFFPHLVSIECPQHIWRADENFEYECGWLLWCSKDNHFFTPRFLQVILLRLAFSFALNIPIRKHRDHPAIQRKCSIWKNGISWLNEDGIEVLVEMREQNQVVTVMMRCDEVSETRIECIHLRSSLVQKILRTREEFCSKVSTTEAFIKPDELQYPLRPPQDLTLFSLNDVARSVINKKRNVTCSDGISLMKLENLLLFEPYSDLGREVLKELLDKEKKDTEVTDELLNRIASEIVRKKDSKYIDYKKECFLQLFNPYPASLQEGGTKGPVQELVKIFQLWRARSKDRSYEGFRRKLDEYSVFCGRNPLELGMYIQ